MSLFTFLFGKKEEIEASTYYSEQFKLENIREGFKVITMGIHLSVAEYMDEIGGELASLNNEQLKICFIEALGIADFTPVYEFLTDYANAVNEDVLTMEQINKMRRLRRMIPYLNGTKKLLDGKHLFRLHTVYDLIMAL